MAIIQMTVNVECPEEEKLWFSLYDPKGNWIVDWGDGVVEVNSGSHSYNTKGVYQITAEGNFTIEQLKCPFNIISLDKEEGCGITDLDFCFQECNQLVSVPKDWDVSNVKYMDYMFESCDSLNQGLSHWDMSNVIVIEGMFNACSIKEEFKPRGYDKNGYITDDS